MFTMHFYECIEVAYWYPTTRTRLKKNADVWCANWTRVTVYFLHACNNSRKSLFSTKTSSFCVILASSPPPMRDANPVEPTKGSKDVSKPPSPRRRLKWLFGSHSRGKRHLSAGETPTRSETADAFFDDEQQTGDDVFDAMSSSASTARSRRRGILRSSADDQTHSDESRFQNVFSPSAGVSAESNANRRQRVDYVTVTSSSTAPLDNVVMRCDAKRSDKSRHQAVRRSTGSMQSHRELYNQDVPLMTTSASTSKIDGAVNGIVSGGTISAGTPLPTKSSPASVENKFRGRSSSTVEQVSILLWMGFQKMILVHFFCQ